MTLTPVSAACSTLSTKTIGFTGAYDHNLDYMVTFIWTNHIGVLNAGGYESCSGVGQFPTSYSVTGGSMQKSNDSFKSRLPLHA